MPTFMKIHTALQKGEYHLNHCEDYIFTGSIGADIVLCAVMDGCTMGIDSYFAATLTGRLLKKLAKGMGYMELNSTQPLYTNLEGYAKHILRALMAELTLAKTQLILEKNELLTTLILLLVNKTDSTGMVLAIGDGIASINGTITKFDQGNKPDYLGYHLSDDFDNWYAGLTQKIHIAAVKDVSIATDGIDTFTPFAIKTVRGNTNPVDFLLCGDLAPEGEDPLGKMLKRLEHVYGLKPTDDLALVRVLC